MCLGSLFVPEAYITATRQYVAQANSWSLEELCLEVNVTSAQGAALDACSFGIKGQTTGIPSTVVSIRVVWDMVPLAHLVVCTPRTRLIPYYSGCMSSPISLSQISYLSSAVSIK